MKGTGSAQSAIGGKGTWGAGVECVFFEDWPDTLHEMANPETAGFDGVGRLHRVQDVRAPIRGLAGTELCHGKQRLFPNL